MSEDNIQYDVHNYDPLNKYIEERARIRRTRSVWGYTRSLALFLVALGIFLILAAYAYHLFKKPHDLVKNNSSISENVEKQINQQIVNKDKKIEELKKQIQNKPENKMLQEQLNAIKKEKEELEKKLSEQSNIHINFVKFRRNYNAMINGKKVAVATRYKYKESIDREPYEVNCYVDFQQDDLSTLELGTKYSSFPDGIPDIHKQKLNASGQDFENLRNYCKFN